MVISGHVFLMYNPDFTHPQDGPVLKIANPQITKHAHQMVNITASVLWEEEIATVIQQLNL